MLYFWGMGAPKKNQFWKLRSKHGRDKIFSSPEILWEAAQEYFETVDNRKWIKTEFHGKDAIECHVPNETPYTISGLCVFLHINRDTWVQYRGYEDFTDIIARIEQIIYTQKIEGASVGAFNASIVARELGLVDRSQVEHKEQPLLSEPDESEDE